MTRRLTETRHPTLLRSESTISYAIDSNQNDDELSITQLFVRLNVAPRCYLPFYVHTFAGGQEFSCHSATYQQTT